MKRRILDGDFLDRLDAASLLLKTAMTGFFGGSRKARSYGNTVEFADFREYFPGDDIRRIDWNVYARFEKYFIKLFTDERQMHNQIYIDCSASMACGKPEKAAAALRVAAAFGYLSVDSMDRVSYKLIQGDKSVDLGFKITNKDSFYRAAQALENTDFEGEADLERAIIMAESPGRDDGLTIIISDFLTESNWKKAIDFLLYNRREVMLIQVMSPDELYPDFDGRVHMLDSEAIDIGDGKNMRMAITKKMVAAYQRALDEYEKEIIDFCAARNVTFFTVSSDDPIEKVIFGKGYEAEVIK
ncbi:MAG: DUF58 domain-containing protein [Clostridia bacterium]|nr:DUF58 domain-containing protein [Clostridia bacterium]